jgi:hypothetical protein
MTLKLQSAAVVVQVVLCTAVILGHDSAPTLAVEIRDYAEIPAWRLSRAITEATTIFSGSGVQVEWTRRRWPNADDPQPTPAGANLVTVQIIPVIRDDRIAKNPKTLGAVPGAQLGGRVVYLFSSRIEVVARRNGVDPGALLGMVLAHELGHVLLKGRPHSPTGIMRPFCSGQQTREILAAHGGFTTAEIQLIRSTAAATQSLSFR